jgi:hypothetical protein
MKKNTSEHINVVEMEERSHPFMIGSPLICNREFVRNYNCLSTLIP